MGFVKGFPTFLCKYFVTDWDGHRDGTGGFQCKGDNLS